MSKINKRCTFIISVMLLISLLSAECVLPAQARTTKKTAEKKYSFATIDDAFDTQSVLVILNNDTSLKYLQNGRIDFPELKYKKVNSLSSAKGKRIRTMVEEREALSAIERMLTSDPNQEEISGYRQILRIQLEEDGKEKVLDAIALLEQREDVIYAGPDYVIHGYSETTSTPPENEYWNPEQTINLPGALNMVSNSETIYVGVLDSGIDASHPNLSEKIDEQNSENFVQYDSGNTFENEISPLTDPLGHGTHVAGIISSVAENVKLVSLRVLDSNDSGKSSFLIEALDYVEELWLRENNSVYIPILNFSAGWKVDVENPINDYTYDKPVYEAVQGYCRWGLFICSAGNDLEKVRDVSDSEDTGTIYYPASYDFGYSDNMIVVGASNMADNGLWIDASDTGSNYGRKAVDIFAPGDTILSCYPISLCGESSCSVNHQSLGYHYQSGTSMATPYVTGVAALILSVHPDLTASEVKNLILDNVTNVIHEDTGMYVFHGLCTSGGRLNAYWALYASHSFGDWQRDLTLGCQYRECAECGYKDIEEHSFENTYVNDCVFSECTECGYYREEHTQEHVYVQNDTLTHNMLYPCCNHTVAESHRGAWIDLDATYHTRICTDCGYTQYQTHEECWNDLKNMCMACKRTGPISGSIMRIPLQEETADLNNAP